MGAVVFVASAARRVMVKGWLWLYQICGYQKMSWLFPRVFFHVTLNADVRVQATVLALGCSAVPKLMLLQGSSGL